MSSAVVKAMWSPGWESVVNERAYLYKSVLNEARRHHRGSMRGQTLELRASPSRNADHLPNLRPDVLEAVGSLSVSPSIKVFSAAKSNRMREAR